MARAPDAIAVSSPAEAVTYAELDERANRIARRLLGLGIRPEDPVMVLQERSVEMVASILGIVKAGALYLPLHSAYPLPRLQWIADSVGRPVLLADAIMGERGLPKVPTIVFVDSDAEQRSLPGTDPNVRTGLDHLVHVLYTSGSTGDPMGVAVTHRGVLGLALDSCWDGGGQERILMLAPYAFGVSTYELWVPLLRGGHLVLAPPGRLDVGILRRLITEHQISAVHVTAGLFRVVADEAPECFAGVREVLTGGDVISAKAVQQVLKACPDTVVRATYGATETSAFITNSPMRAPYSMGLTVPVGRGMDHTRLHVLDEHLRPLSAGEVGDLYVAGDRLARGYYRRPDVTAERFVADPFAGAGQRMYRMGDQVRVRQDGLIEFVGRSGDQVKIRGYRVELAEVESVLARYHGLAHAVVVAREVEDGEKRLIAYVVAETGRVGTGQVDTGPFDIGGLRAHATELLPEYMVPSAFVMLDSLPLTPNGKVDRKALPEPVVEASSNYRAPQTARQEILCSLFAEVLGVPRVGLDDSFFDLHGESLMAMRLISSIQDRLSIELLVSDIFDAPTVAELDQQVEKALQQSQA
ncbi:MAG TPA: non-ribosomal peptide synthetase [Streptosporangiaceae bacterium]|nr:non-ribosomal peptide synthetase [Streptosporangiaceae bacterium]